MYRRAILVGVVMTALAVAFYAGCTSPTETEEEQRPGLRTVVIKDNVFVADGVMTLLDISDSTYTYNYSGNAPDIAVGDIVIDSQQGGHIREVTEVVSGLGAVTLQTRDAALVDAVLRATFADSLGLTLEPAGSGKAPAPEGWASRVNFVAPGVIVSGEGLSFSDVELFIGTVRSKDVSAVLRSGALAFTPTYHYSCYIEGSRVWSLESVAKGNLQMNADLQVAASDSINFVSPPALLYSISHTFTTMIDRVPFTQEVTLEFYGACAFDMQTALEATYTVASAGPLSVGLRYASANWMQVFSGDVEADPGQIQANGHAIGSVHCFVRPEVTVRCYSLAGLRIGLQPYLGLINTSDGFFWGYEALTGFDLDVMASLEILDPVLPVFDRYAEDLLTAVSSSGQEQVGGLIVQSTPGGASIMLDGAPTGRTTPDTLAYFSAGDHQLRLYREGYNEHLAIVGWEGGFVTHQAALTTPGWPRPAFSELSPVHGSEYGDNVITVSGVIQLEDESGIPSPFDGNLAVLTLNGVEQLIEVVGGDFSADVNIFSGQNTLQYRATGPNGNTGVSESMTVVGTFVPDDVVITLSWNSPNADLDLHVWNPRGEHCYYVNRQITEGFLDIDDVHGYGPETFTATDAMFGTYTVKINAYDLHGDPSSEASVAIWLNGGVPELFGPYEFTVADSNGSNPAAWWEVTLFAMAAGAKSVKVEPLSAERIVQIEVDMRNLPPKR